MFIKLRVSLIATLLTFVASPALVQAKTSDRKQPTDIKSDYYDGTTKGGAHLLKGNVIVTQGTMTAKGAQATLWENDGKSSRVLMTGSPVVLTETLDDGSPMKGTAAQVDYNLETDIAIFTGNVVLTQPKGTMSSEKVVYNMKTGQVQSGGNGQRVHMVLQPKS